MESIGQVRCGTVQRLESTGQFCYDTVQEWRVKDKFGVALYKTGEYVTSLLLHYTRLYIIGQFFVAM